MSKDEKLGRPPDVTDNEIVDTVKALIEATDSPVVERRLVQEELDYSEPTTRTRLNSLVQEGKIGRYDASGVHVYWVSNEIESGGEADSPEIISDIQSIEPEDVPREKVVEIASAKLSDYQPNTIYRSIHDYGDALLRWGIVAFAVGIMLLLTNTRLSEVIPPVVQAQIALVGFGLVAFGGILQASSVIGQKLSERYPELLP